MTNSQLRDALALGVSTATLLTSAAWPQSNDVTPSSATPATPSTQIASSGLAEVVVTAERRTTNLQKVPVAVSVFTGKERDTIGINSVQDVTNFAPGFTYDQGDTHAYIRGVGRQSIIVSDENRVAVYEDGFYVYSPYQLGKSSLFLAQEQIERGPQNVGGRNADGGSIDMISVRPTDTPYAEARASISSYDHYEVEGAVSGEVAPGIQARLAAYDNQQDEGYFKNSSGGAAEGGDIHEYYVEGQAQAKLGDHADLWVRAFSAGWHNRGDAGARDGYESGSWNETTLTDANAYPAAGLFVNANYGYAANSGAARTAAAAAGEDILPISVTLRNSAISNNPAASNDREFAAAESRDVSLKNYNDINYVLTYHFSNMDLKYLGGFQGYDYGLNYAAQDSDVESYTLPGSTTTSPYLLAYLGLPSATTLVLNPTVNVNYQEKDWWTSHEITLQSSSDKPLQWIGGAFYYYQKYENPIEISDPSQPNLTNPVLTLPTISATAGYTPGAAAIANANDTISYQNYDMSVESEAVYGQAAYKIGDDFRVTGSLRYTHDSKQGIEYTRYVDFSSALIDGYSPYLGAATPSLDVTKALICPTGLVSNCYSGALAKGVKSMAALITSGALAGDWERRLGDSSSAVTGGAGLEYTPNRDTFIYARYSRGYQGLSFNAGYTSYNPEVNPESINAYEVGYKQNIGRKASFDSDIFYYDYHNIQLPISVNNSTALGSIIQSEFINIPKAESIGFEFEGSWAPIDHLLLTASYSFDYTAILTGCRMVNNVVVSGSTCLLDTNDPDAVETGAKAASGQTGGVRYQSVRGSPLPQAPKNKVAFNAAYTIPVDPGSIVLSATYVWRDVEDGTVFDRKYDNAPSWDQVDFRALWRGPADRYEIIGFVKNVFNSTGYEAAAAGSALSGTDSAVSTAATGLSETNTFILTPPRTYGLELRYKFF